MKGCALSESVNSPLDNEDSFWHKRQTQNKEESVFLSLLSSNLPISHVILWKNTFSEDDVCYSFLRKTVLSILLYI